MKKKRYSRDGSVFYMSGVERTRLQMPRHDGFAVGHGPHGRAGYDRRRMRGDLAREIREEGR